MTDTIKITCQERKERLRVEKELNDLKEDFAKLKGMVHLVVASLNLQNNGFLTEDIQDIFNPCIVEELSLDEEVPQENLVPVPVPGPLFEVPNTLWEIPLSPSPLLQTFLSEPVIIASSIPPLGSSPHTGGEGLWKQVITWWEHCGIRCNVLGLGHLLTQQQLP